MDETRYIKGFNQGYLLKQHKPDLFKTVEDGLSENSPYKEGFRDGGKEFEKERTKQQIKERMSSGKTNNRERS